MSANHKRQAHFSDAMEADISTGIEAPVGEYGRRVLNNHPRRSAATTESTDGQCGNNGTAYARKAFQKDIDTTPEPQSPPWSTVATELLCGIARSLDMDNLASNETLTSTTREGVFDRRGISHLRTSVDSARTPRPALPPNPRQTQQSRESTARGSHKGG